jgi:peroxiredoxin
MKAGLKLTLDQKGEGMPALQVGTQAPDFELASHVDKKFALNGFKGRKTVVAFMPFAFTGG